GGGLGTEERPLGRTGRNVSVVGLGTWQLGADWGEVHEAAAFDALDALVADGSIAAYGVSVERESEALAAIARPGVQSVQIILNAFRLKPLERVLPAAAAARTAIIARVPLASGLLSGRYTEATT